MILVSDEDEPKPKKKKKKKKEPKDEPAEVIEEPVEIKQEEGKF